MNPNNPYNYPGGYPPYTNAPNYGVQNPVPSNMGRGTPMVYTNTTPVYNPTTNSQFGK